MKSIKLFENHTRTNISQCIDIFFQSRTAVQASLHLQSLWRVCANLRARFLRKHAQKK